MPYLTQYSHIRGGPITTESWQGSRADLAAVNGLRYTGWSKGVHAPSPVTRAKFDHPSYGGSWKAGKGRRL